MARNTKDALKDIRAGKPSGLFKLALVGATPYIAGEAMLGVYYALLGEDPPKENSDWMTRYRTTLWKGEFLGILSDVLSPYEDRDGLFSTMTPAIYNYMWDVSGTLSALWDDKLKPEQGAEDILKKTFSVYNGAMKVIRKKQSPYNRGFMKYNKLWADFEQELGPDVSAVEWGIGRNTKHYRDLRDAWNLSGPDDDFMKIYYATKMQLTHDKIREYGGGIKNLKEAIKETERYLDDFIKNKMNPNPAYSLGKAPHTKRKKMLFLKWLNKDEQRGSEYMKELSKLQAEYNKRLYIFKALKNKYRGQYGF